jgi:hypothetical protein
LAERLVQQLPHRARPGVAWVGRRRECLVLHLGSDAIRPWHGRDPLYGGEARAHPGQRNQGLERRRATVRSGNQ